MSIARFAEQTWPDLLSQADEKYVPSRSDLFPNVVVMKLTKRQIEKASRGIHPKPVGKEATTIVNNNIRRHLNENNENVNDAAAPTVVTASVHNTDDIPDDPIPMTSDNDNDAFDIDSDSDLPDLSNPKKIEKKNESKFKISEKKVSDDYDKGDKKYKEDKKSIKIKYDEIGKSEKKSNEINKSEKIKYDGNSKSEKRSHDTNSSKHSEKHGDRNKYNEKDRMKNRKSSSDKRESDKDKKEKYKSSSKIDDSRKTDKSSTEGLNVTKNVSTSSISSKSSSSKTTDKSETDSRKADKKSTENSNSSKISSTSSSSSKSSASNSTDNSETESFSSKDNSTSVPPAKPNLLAALAKTREVKKQKEDNQEPKAFSSKDLLERARQLKKQKSENQEQKAEADSNKFVTPLVIKTEPKDITSQDDTMDFQAPSGSTALPALPDDGDFESQIDSDQETVAFGGTPEKLDDEFNMIENKNSSKKDKIESKERSEKKDSKDKNKRKRENSGSSIESKKRKGDDYDKKKKEDRDENKEKKEIRTISNQKETIEVSKDINKHENSIKGTQIAAKSLPPFAAIPTRDAVNPASVSTTKSLPLVSAATKAPISSVSQPGITSEAVQSTSTSLSAKQLKEEKLKNMRKIIELNKSNSKKESFIKDLQREYEEINNKIIHTESKTTDIKSREEKNNADYAWLEKELEKDTDDEDQIELLTHKLMESLETKENIKDEKTKLEEEKLELTSKLVEVKNSLQAKKAELEADEKLLAVLKEKLKPKSNTSSPGPGSPVPEGVQKNNSQQELRSPALSNVSVSNPSSPLIRSESPLDSCGPAQAVITTASVVTETTTSTQPKDSPVSNVSPVPSPLSLSSTKTSTSSAMDVATLPTVADVVPNPSVSVIQPNPSVPVDAVLSSTPTCFRCGKQGGFTCCGDTIYCGVKCQEEDFDRHQDECENQEDGENEPEDE